MPVKSHFSIHPLSGLSLLLVASTALADSCPCMSRPDFSAGLDRIVSDLISKTPALKHINPAEVLFVASDARHASRATTRPTRFPGGSISTPDGRYVKPITTINGKAVKYIVELRPKFFRHSTVESRVKTLFHELHHMGDSFDGSIPSSKSHKGTVDDEFEQIVGQMTKSYLSNAPKDLLKLLATNGEVMMRMWFDRPKNRVPISDTSGKRLYTEKDIFIGPVEMITTPSPLKSILFGKQ